MRRQLAFTFVLGTGVGLVGCQSPMLGGLPMIGRGATAASTAPDVSKQKFSGLSQELSSGAPASTGMGGARPVAETGFLASWKKATAAITGSGTVKAKNDVPEDDPLRLDRLPRKIGPEVYVGAARLLENQGKFAEAEDKYRDALKAAPEDLNALVGLARLYDRQGQPQKAIEVYQKANQAYPTNGLIVNDMGLCYRRQRQVERSITAFRKAVEVSPDNAKYRNNLAASLLDAGKENEAFEQLASANPPPVAHYNLAYLLSERGQRTAAISHLQQALVADPSLKPASDMLAQLGASAAVTSRIESAAQSLKVQVIEASQPAKAVIRAHGNGAINISSQRNDPATEEPPTYHIGDDARSSVESTQRPAVSGASWIATGPAAPPRTTQPLPPVDE